jgi:2-keto-4-pentenoate hydratase
VEAQLEAQVQALQRENADLKGKMLLRAWIDKQWITCRADYPSVGSLDEVYAIHRAMANDPMNAQLGGCVGYKQGGIGAVEGIDGPVDAVYGLLFGCGMAEAPAGISHRDFNLFGAEVEFAFVMSRSLQPRTTLYTDAEVADAVGAVHLCIELCGRRHTIADATNLENLADSSCAGGVIMGKKLEGVDLSSLAATTTKLLVNGVEKAAGKCLAKKLELTCSILTRHTKFLLLRLQGLGPNVRSALRSAA